MFVSHLCRRLLASRFWFPIYILLPLTWLPATANSADNESVLVWRNQPIPITLKVGEEVRVSFPTDVVLQVPIGTTDVLQSLQPVPNLIYWTPVAPFERQRILATSHDGQSLYLIDLSASAEGARGPIRIEDPERLVAAQETSVTPAFEAPSDPPEFVLSRFAAQSLYAPTRLIPTNPDIYPVEGVAIDPYAPLIAGQAGERYRLRVVGAWSGYGLYVTAVLVINESPLSLPVRPDLVRGAFDNITPQHLSLGPSGTLEDRTTLYLISTLPFADALKEDDRYGY